MAIGDYLIRRNDAETDSITTSNFDSTWDTEVASVGTDVTYSTGVFTLVTAGRYLVIYTERFSTTDTTNNERFEIQGRLLIGGSEDMEGACQGTIRKTDGVQETVLHGCAIVQSTGSTSIRPRFYRTDDSTVGTCVRDPDYGGVQIIRLDETDAFARYVTTSAKNSPSGNHGGFVDVVWDSNVEQDTGFSRSGANITITDAQRYFVSVSIPLVATGGTSQRQEFVTRITLDDTEVEGTRSSTYIRISDNCKTGVLRWAGIIDVAASDVLAVEMERSDGETWGNQYQSGSNIQLWKLPSGNETFVVQATTGNYNAADVDFSWDTIKQLDAAAFTHTAGNSNVDVDVADDYLVFASWQDVACGAARAVPMMRFVVNNVVQNYAANSKYHRSLGANDAGFAAGTLVIGLAADVPIEVRSTQLSDITTACDSDHGSFSGLRLGSIFAGGDQNVTVGATAAGTNINAPGVRYDQSPTVGATAASTVANTTARIDQTVPVTATAASTAVVTADRVDQTVDVGATGASTAVVAPDRQFDQSPAVGAVAAGTAIITPDRVDQTVDIGATAASTAVVAPDVTSSQAVDVPAVAASTAVVAPDAIHQTVPVPATGTGTATVTTDRIDQTVPVPATGASAAVAAVDVAFDQTTDVGTVPASTAAVAPDRVDQTTSVSAVGASTGGVISTDRVDQTVPVGAIGASTAILAPSVGGEQQVTVPATGTGTAVVAPDRVDQTTPVGAIGAGTASPAPASVDRAIDVAAVGTGTAVVAPDRVDQTVPVGATSASTAVVAPTVGAGQVVDVGATGTGTAVAALVRVDQTVPVTATVASTAAVAPTVETGQPVAVTAVAAGTAVAALARVDQTVPVPAVAAAVTVAAVDLAADQFVAVGAQAAGTAVVAPDQVAQTVALPAVAASTAAPAPSRVDRALTAPVVAAATAVPAPARVDQTVTVGAIGTGTAVVAPFTGGIPQDVDVPVIAAGTAGITLPCVTGGITGAPTDLDTSLIPRVHEIVEARGKLVTFVEATTHDYVSTTGKTTDVTANHTEKITPPFPYRRIYAPTDTLEDGDLLTYLPAQGLAFTPVNGMQVLVDAAAFNVVKVGPIHSGQQVALYLLQLRGGASSWTPSLTTTGLDDSLIPTVLSLINRLGKVVNVTDEGAQAYDSATGDVSVAGATTYQVRITPPDPYEDKYVDGEVLQSGDLRTFLPASGLAFTPSVGMTMQVMNCKPLTVVAMGPIFTGEQIALYELAVRG